MALLIAGENRRINVGLLESLVWRTPGDEHGAGTEFPFLDVQSKPFQLIVEGCEVFLQSVGCLLVEQVAAHQTDFGMSFKIIQNFQEMFPALQKRIHQFVAPHVIFETQSVDSVDNGIPVLGMQLEDVVVVIEAD